MVKCVVSSCPNRSNNQNRDIFNRPQKRFFSFPKDPTRIKIWLAALRETEKQEFPEPHFICEDHFLPEDISNNGVSSDAIPIMPPCLDGDLGMISHWGAEPSLEEEEGQWAREAGFDDEEGGEDVPVNMEPPPPCPVNQEPNTKTVSSTETPRDDLNQREEVTPKDVSSKFGESLGSLTRPFLTMLLAAPDGVLDLRQVVESLRVSQRRVYSITSVLAGFNFIRKVSANQVKWIEKCPLSEVLSQSPSSFPGELANLKLVEDTLDSLIKSCAQQLFQMTDNKQNSSYAYITNEDIRQVSAFQGQTVIVVKAPEETKLEVPAPTEDNIKVHLKGGKGPINVVACDMETDERKTSSCFVTLEESQIRTATLHTETCSGV